MKGIQEYSKYMKSNMKVVHESSTRIQSNTAIIFVKHSKLPQHIINMEIVFFFLFCFFKIESIAAGDLVLKTAGDSDFRPAVYFQA